MWAIKFIYFQLRTHRPEECSTAMECQGIWSTVLFSSVACATETEILHNSSSNILPPNEEYFIVVLDRKCYLELFFFIPIQCVTFFRRFVFLIGLRARMSEFCTVGGSTGGKHFRDSLTHNNPSILFRANTRMRQQKKRKNTNNIFHYKYISNERNICDTSLPGCYIQALEHVSHFAMELNNL